MQNTTSEIRAWTPQAVAKKIGDFETEVKISAAVKMTLQPSSEGWDGQQLGSKPPCKLYAARGSRRVKRSQQTSTDSPAMRLARERSPGRAGSSPPRHGYLRDPPADAASSAAEIS